MSQSSVIADLSARKTVKLYDSAKRIPADQIAEIYEALRLSPSSINSQPWKFIVIESENAKERLETTFANKFQVNQKHAKDASHIILFAYNPSYKRSDFDKVVDQDIQNGRTKEEEEALAQAEAKGLLVNNWPDAVINVLGPNSLIAAPNVDDRSSKQRI